jgi:hypothetical protein
MKQPDLEELIARRQAELATLARPRRRTLGDHVTVALATAVVTFLLVSAWWWS